MADPSGLASESQANVAASCQYPFDVCRKLSVLRSSAYESTDVVVVDESVRAIPGLCVSLPSGTKAVRKTLSAQPGLGGAYFALFEATQAGRFFRHLPAVYAFCWHEGELHVLMEFIEGVTLLEFISYVGASASIARQLFPGICDAVTELHSFNSPIIHRDLKPSNVMVRPDGTVVLIDFGIARRYQEGAPDDTAHFGTRSFAPPEQFGFKQTDQRSDVYALGHLLAFCLTGSLPKHPGPISHSDDGGAKLPPVLGRVAQRATSFDPTDRYESAARLKRAFWRADARDAGREDARGVARPVWLQRLISLSHVGGKAWNVALALLAAFLMASSLYASSEPPQTQDTLPQWLRLASYCVLVPALFASLAWALADKRRFMPWRKRPWIASFGGGWALFGFVFLGVFAVLAVASFLHGGVAR